MYVGVRIPLVESDRAYALEDEATPEKRTDLQDEDRRSTSGGKKEQRGRIAVRCWVILVIALAVAGCGVLDGVKQVRTYADMQTICGKISDSKAGDPERIVSEVVRSEVGGRDAWGHPFVWYVEPHNDGFSYVLISYGSDGQPDFARKEDYFHLRGYSVRHDPRRDLVFVNGRSVTDAGL